MDAFSETNDVRVLLLRMGENGVLRGLEEDLSSDGHRPLLVRLERLCSRAII